jgi:glycosyltransferase involved in cell wall biosynthesis
MAIACWNFPIYSQTFVYQELTQLIQNGFDIKFLYGKINSRENLPKQFSCLWDARFLMVLNPNLGKQDFAYFKKQMPEKVDELVDMLSRTSGMSSKEICNYYHFLQAFSFARLVEAYKPDYLHSYFFYEGTLFAMVASFLFDIPRGVSCYADHLLDDYELKAVPMHIDHCDLIIATSERIKQELLELTPQIDPSCIIVKPNAINVSHFPEVDRTEPENGNPHKLLCISRIEPKKGLLYLIEAVRILHDQSFNIELHLIGGVDDSSTNKEYAHKLKIRIAELGLSDSVFLEGIKPEPELNRFLEMSHMFVAPFIETEYGDKDGIPTSLLEAMSTGIPVLATDAGSILEVIDNDCDGMIVPQKDAVSLANATADLINDHEKRKQLGKNAAQKIRLKFDVTVCEHLFHNRISTILHSRKNHDY